MEKKILTDTERIEKNRRIAEAYYAAYDRKAVKDGATYADWVYASHATYWSPYFGNGMRLEATLQFRPGDQPYLRGGFRDDGSAVLFHRI